MSSKSINAAAQARNGSKPTRATRPIIGIDPGAPLAVATLTPGRSASFSLVSRGAGWRATLEPYLPAHVFIEQPLGGDDTLQIKAAHYVNFIAKELEPFNRGRQLIPVTVWRKEILGDGAAPKQAAIEWARETYPTVFGALDFTSHDLAEAFCIAEYGRRVVTNRLQHAPPGLYGIGDLSPSTAESFRPPKYELDRDDRLWPRKPPPEPPRQVDPRVRHRPASGHRARLGDTLQGRHRTLRRPSRPVCQRAYR